jgi:cobalt-precorrin-5B (C1)-methyltransferase
MTKELRYGYTTGSSATAAAHAGLLHLLSGKSPRQVTILTPLGKKLILPVHAYEEEKGGIRVTVIKHGGDDPDVTHETPIQCVVSLLKDVPVTEVCIHGGRGVGRVTKPGLPVAVGEPAINPAPRAQLTQTILDLLEKYEMTGRVEVTIEVPQGEQLAQKTLNPRLGVVGGISILGTRGTVKPFSNAAYLTTIKQCLRTARALGQTTIAFNTGGRSERLLQSFLPAWPEESFITVADFFAPSMILAAELGMNHVVWGVFFGKLVKQALGHPNTHAKNSEIDFATLASWWTDLGLSRKIGTKIAGANTAMQIQDMIVREPGHERYYEALVRRARQHAREYGKGKPSVDYCLFDFSGVLLFSTITPETP